MFTFFFGGGVALSAKIFAAIFHVLLNTEAKISTKTKKIR
jgi:hypothetical protein